MSEALFTANNLSKQYQMGDIQLFALRGVDFSLHPGEFVVILGPSGSGKSTLLNILGGLDSASGGEVRYRDQELTHADESGLTHYRREHIGFVFQSYNLIANLTAQENVALVTDIAKHPMPVEQALEMVGLSARAHHFPAQLSGGEQQRVAIARAIAKQPDVLLCDEPTGALDCETGRLVLKAIASVNKTLNTAVVVITHNVSIAQMADRVVYLADGLISHVEVNTHPCSADELQW